MKAALTFNVGSSSVKFSLFAIEGAGGLGDNLLRGNLADLHGTPRLSLSGHDGDASEIGEALVAGGTDIARLVPAIADWCAGALEGIEIKVAGHRIVHGGTRFTGPARPSDEVLSALDALSVFAPSHQPHNLAGVRALAAANPAEVQTLSFDTAFHRRAPRTSQLYALPRALTEEGIIRYGFHGLSFAHIAETLPDMLGERPHDRVVALHLGSGASACAMAEGRGVATSMGLTALDGLMMATRCGDLDPGVVLHLIQDRGMAAGDVARMLYSESGLRGVSGISADMRTLLESDAPEAAEAVALYVHRIVREVGALAAAMGGLDTIVFTGGVGENAAPVRASVCAALGWMGVDLDTAANATVTGIISAPESRVTVCVMAADEERIIAEEAAAVLAG